MALDALKITACLFIMAVPGLLWDEPLSNYFTPVGFGSVAITFFGIYCLVFLWVIWFNRKPRR